MFESFGTLINPLYPLLHLIGAVFRDTGDDEADDGDPDSSNDGHAGEHDDDDDSSEDDEEDEDEDDESDDDDDEDDEDDNEDDLFADDLDDDLDDEEITRRNADTAVSKSNAQVDKTLTTMVRQMVRFPESAESVIDDLRSEQPELASRLAKMYENEKGNSLKEALKDAPDSVRDVLAQLVDKVDSIQQNQSAKDSQQDRETFINWVKTDHPYLHPKSEERKTKSGGRLFREFRKAVDRMPTDEPVTDDMLEDALAIAKRRTGWDNSRVSKDVKKQAAEQAQKARSGVAGTGKGGSKKKGEAKAEPNRITALFGGDEKRQAKVNKIKKRKFKNLGWD